MIARLKIDNTKQEPQKAFGGPPAQQQPINVRSPFLKAYREDLLFANDYIDDRLDEIDSIFSSPAFSRPDGNQHSSAFERGLHAEEKELKNLKLEISHELGKALPAHDDKQTKAKLNAMVEQKIDSSLYQIQLFESGGDYREARLRRLLLPQLRIDIRAQNFRGAN